uniref:Actin-related protein 8 n=1 Tax=Aegilops tauschii subsp. strangulata TaxID=200361 RepID=A0A453DBZ1_AEGTS
MVDQAIASMAGASMLLLLGVVQLFWNLVTSSPLCMQDFVTFSRQSITGMHVKPSARPIVVALPLCHSDDTEAARASRKQYKETLYSVLFDMNVPAVCAVDQALLALYAARRTSGIVVNIGFNVTSVVPIFQGRVMREIGIETVGQGALKLTGFLKELLQRRNISFESLYTVRTIKEVGSLFIIPI